MPANAGKIRVSASLAALLALLALAGLADETGAGNDAMMQRCISGCEAARGTARRSCSMSDACFWCFRWAVGNLSLGTSRACILI